MSQTNYPSVTSPSRANGKSPAKDAAAAQAGKSPKGAQEPAASATSNTAKHGDASVSQEAIAKRAYEKYVDRGGAHGSDQDDWAAAERELRAEAGGR
jgi:hypothetical protein